MLLLPKTRTFLVIVCLISTLCALVAHSQPAPGPMLRKRSPDFQIQHEQSPDPESLPPDTFRKLAQVLYHRGGMVKTRLSRKYFDNTNVTCNDGSVSGYYIRRNYQSKRWIIFLEGKKQLILTYHCIG